MTPAEQRELEIAFRGAPAAVADRRKVRTCALCGLPFWATSKEIRDPECQREWWRARWIHTWRPRYLAHRGKPQVSDDELEARLCSAFAGWDRDERWKRRDAA